MRDTGTGPPGRSCASGGNFELRIADCGFEGRASNPQSQIPNPQFVSPAVMQLQQLFQRFHPPPPPSPQQPPPDGSGGEGIPTGATACLVPDAAERRHT